MGAQQKRMLRSWVALCLLAILACTPLLSYAERIYEGPGWASPEDAILFYLEGLKEQDLEKMISAFAVETYIDHFDLEMQLERIRAYNMAMVPRLPNSHDLLRAINVEARKNEIVQTVLWQMTTICLPERDFSMTTSFPKEDADENSMTAFVEALENAFAAVDFDTLQHKLFIPPERINERYMSEQNQANIVRSCAPFGVDEAHSVVALFTVDGKFCVLCCDVARYGDRWFMFRPGGNIANLLGLPLLNGGVVAVPQEDMGTLLAEFGGIALEIIGSIFGG